MNPIIRPLVAFFVLSVTSPDVFCQDSVKIKESALTYADSLIKTDVYQNWSVYADLAPAGVLKYYGGKNGFVEHVQKVHPRTVSSHDEDYPERKITSLRAVDDQWQCVIQVSRHIYRNDNKRYHIVTYFVGQSKDEGATWRIFDASYNSVANIIYMMPDVIGDLPIPQPYIISEEEELAKQQSSAAPARKKAAPNK